LVGINNLKTELNITILELNQNQTFHYIHRIRPKRASSLRRPTPRHSTKVLQLLGRKYWRVGEPFATLRTILPAWDSNP